MTNANKTPEEIGADDLNSWIADQTINDPTADTAELAAEILATRGNGHKEPDEALINAMGTGWILEQCGADDTEGNWASKGLPWCERYNAGYWAAAQALVSEPRRAPDARCHEHGCARHRCDDQHAGPDEIAPQLTAETVTNQQIRDLRTEAWLAGDDLQVALCLVALEDSCSPVIGGADPRVDEQRSELERLGVIPEHVGADVRARQLCADAINAARTQVTP